MTSRLVIRPLAQREMIEAAQWYADRSETTALRFSRALQNALRAIESDPFRYPVVDGTTRRFVVAAFPYSLFYRITSEEIVVLSCFHGHRHPDQWRSRE